MNQQPGKKLLAVFAHPDDESIMMGGALAYYSKRGVDVHLLCATRGEWGSISDKSLIENENLGAVREIELRRACEILGVNLAGFLDCPDAGVNYTDWYETEEKIVSRIRELRPQIVVTFGPDGLYWHPDHIAIGDITTRAFASAANVESFSRHFEEGLEPFQPAKLYYAVFPDFLMSQLAAEVAKKNASANLWGFSAETFGVPSHQITTMLNVEETLVEKMRALRAHQTQFAPDNIFSLVDDETAKRFLSREYFRLIEPAAVSKNLEIDLFAPVETADDHKTINGHTLFVDSAMKNSKPLERNSGRTK